MVNYPFKLRKAVPNILFILFILLSIEKSKAQRTDDKDWTDNQFPSYIRRMNQFGERPDWSHDGKKVLFVSKSFGDVFEMEIATGTIRPMAHHYYHGGYLRALYLSNGDILLLGPKGFPSDNWQAC